MNRIMAVMIIVLSGTTAALSTLPYGWAHIAATACAAAMGAMGIGAGSYNLGVTAKNVPTQVASEFWPTTDGKSQ